MGLPIADWTCSHCGRDNPAWGDRLRCYFCAVPRKDIPGQLKRAESGIRQRSGSAPASAPPPFPSPIHRFRWRKKDGVKRLREQFEPVKGWL